MKILLPNPRRLAPLLASAVLLGFVPAARADQAASTFESVAQSSSLAAERVMSAAPQRNSELQISSAITDASVTSAASTVQRATSSTPGIAADASPTPSIAPHASPPPSGSSDASAVGASAAGAAHVEGGASSPEAASLSGSATDAESPTSLPSGGSISKAVQQAIDEALSRQAQGSDTPGAGAVAAAATATSQLIWQLEIAECTAHCVGTSQGQRAVQQNTTSQVLDGAPRPAGRARARDRPMTETHVRQIQLGCISHCYGATTSTPAPAIARYAQVLEEALRQIAAGLPSLAPILALEQSVVAQSSYQSQTGGSPSPSRGPVTQSEEASQVHDTRQQGDPSASGTRAGSAPGVTPEATTFGAVNQTVQGIWQLQIGCLIDCHETEQYQDATQRNATVEKAIGAGGADTPSASTEDSVTQVIFQAQIGCVMWCFDANERQTASSQSTLTGGAPEPSAPPLGEAAPNTQGAGPVSAPPTASAGSAPLSFATAAVPAAASMPVSSAAASSKRTAPRRSLRRRSHMAGAAGRAGAPYDAPPVATSWSSTSASRRFPAARAAGFTPLPPDIAPAAVQQSSVPVALAALALCALLLLCVALLGLRAALSPSN